MMELLNIEKILFDSGKLDLLSQPFKSDLIDILKLRINYSSSKNNIQLNINKTSQVSFILTSSLMILVENIKLIFGVQEDSIEIPNDPNDFLFECLYKLFIENKEKYIDYIYEKQLISLFLNNDQIKIALSILAHLSSCDILFVHKPLNNQDLFDYLENSLGLVTFYDDIFVEKYKHIYCKMSDKYLLNRLIYLTLFIISKSNPENKTNYDNLLYIINKLLNGKKINDINNNSQFKGWIN